MEYSEVEYCYILLTCLKNQTPEILTLMVI